MNRQFVESLKRLYLSQMVKKEKIEELFNNKKISEIELKYILNVNQKLCLFIVSFLYIYL